MKKNRKFYLIYQGLIIVSILLLTTSLVLRYIGYIEIDTIFTIIKISLILLIISIFFKSKI